MLHRNVHQCHYKIQQYLLILRKEIHYRLLSRVNKDIVFKIFCFLETFLDELRLKNAYHYHINFTVFIFLKRFLMNWDWRMRVIITVHAFFFFFLFFFLKLFLMNWDWWMLNIITVFIFFKNLSQWTEGIPVIIIVFNFFKRFSMDCYYCAFVFRASSSPFDASLTYWRWRRHLCPLSRFQPSGIEAALSPGHPGCCPPPHPLRPVLRVRRHACAEPPGLGGAAARVSLPLRLQQQRQEVRAAGPRSVWH